MTTIRPATTADIPGLVTMAQAFVSQTAYRGLIRLSPAHVEALATRLLANEQALVLVAAQPAGPVGMLAMHWFEHPMSGERVAAEVVWWMDPACRGAGVKMLRAAEVWARDVGATVMTMIAPADRVGQFYLRQGYQPIETSFQRRLS